MGGNIPFVQKYLVIEIANSMEAGKHKSRDKPIHDHRQIKSQV
jgi:hypothetical protein